MHGLNLKSGDWVEVLGKEEILRTLDKQGQLDQMPFMPQMFQYCGQRFQVFKRAHKTCDTVFPIRGRWMADTVHLETRCDGRAYGGCQAACLLFWKEAWLKRVIGGDAGAELKSPEVGKHGGCTEADVLASTRASSQRSDTDPTYVCQATQLPYATTKLNWWDVRQYTQDFTSGNASLAHMARGFIYAGYYNLSRAGIGLGPFMRWFYDRFQSVVGGPLYPRKQGFIPVGQKTPAVELNLQPGELVRVKSYEQILKTLDADNKNRGLFFDAEAVPFCGGSYRVLSRVSQILDEKTGKMLKMKTPSIILEGVFCQARYSECRMFCPRAIYSYWREAWLERVDVPTNLDAGDTGRRLVAGTEALNTPVATGRRYMAR